MYSQREATAALDDLPPLDALGSGLDWSAWRETRARALERFRALGFPTRKDERWKYTNVDPIARTRFARGLPAHAPTRPLADRRLPGLDAGCLAFVNGHFDAGASRAPGVPDGVIVAPLASAAVDHRARVEPHLGRLADFDAHAFTALNTAYAVDGAVILVPPGVTVEAPIYLLFAADAPAGAPTAGHPRVLVVAGEGSAVRVVEHYVGAGDGPTLTNAVTEIAVGAGARVEHLKIQDEAAGGFHVARVAVRQGRDSRFESRNLAFGARLARTDIEVTLDGEGAECRLDGLFAVEGEQHVDNETWVDHAKPHATSAQLYKGIVGGRGHGVFTGRVRVREGAAHTNARQSNPNLLLSTKAHVDTRPQLEINNNDVKCTHGATIGRLDPDALFYLRARGVGEEEARRMLTVGFAGEIIDRVEVPDLAAWLRARVGGPALAGFEGGAR